MLLFTCNYVVSVWRGLLFLWVLGMGYVNLLWHSLSLPYNHSSVKHLRVVTCRVSAKFGEVFSSSECLGSATLFNCGTPCAFHIIILVYLKNQKDCSLLSELLQTM